MSRWKRRKIILQTLKNKTELLLQLKSITLYVSMKIPSCQFISCCLWLPVWQWLSAAKMQRSSRRLWMCLISVERSTETILRHFRNVPVRLMESQELPCITKKFCFAVLLQNNCNAGLDSCSGMRRQMLHLVPLSPLNRFCQMVWVSLNENWWNTSIADLSWLLLQRWLPMCSSVGGAGLLLLDDEVWHNKKHQEPHHVVLGVREVNKIVDWPLPSVFFHAAGHQMVQMCSCFHCSSVSFTYICTRVGNKGQQHALSRRLHTENRVDPTPITHPFFRFLLNT